MPIIRKMPEGYSGDNINQLIKDIEEAFDSIPVSAHDYNEFDAGLEWYVGEMKLILICVKAYRDGLNAEDMQTASIGHTTEAEWNGPDGEAALANTTGPSDDDGIDTPMVPGNLADSSGAIWLANGMKVHGGTVLVTREQAENAIHRVPGGWGWDWDHNYTQVKDPHSIGLCAICRELPGKAG